MVVLTSWGNSKADGDPLPFSMDYPSGSNCAAVDWWKAENFRPPNGFPKQCEAEMAKDEYVIVKWDLAEGGGHPVNVSVTQTTNSCFNETAMETIKQRVFPPVTECNPDDLTKNLRERFHYTRVDEE